MSNFNAMSLLAGIGSELRGKDKFLEEYKGKVFTTRNDGNNLEAALSQMANKGKPKQNYNMIDIPEPQLQPIPESLKAPINWPVQQEVQQPVYYQQPVYQQPIQVPVQAPVQIQQPIKVDPIDVNKYLGKPTFNNAPVINPTVGEDDTDSAKILKFLETITENQKKLVEYCEALCQLLGHNYQATSKSVEMLGSLLSEINVGYGTEDEASIELQNELTDIPELNDNEEVNDETEKA